MKDVSVIIIAIVRHKQYVTATMQMTRNENKPFVSQTKEITE